MSNTYGNHFCVHCGAKRENSEQFCRYCGAEFKNIAYPAAAPVPKKKSNTGVIVLAVALVVVFLVLPVIIGGIFGVAFLRNVAPVLVDDMLENDYDIFDFDEWNDDDDWPEEYPYFDLYDNVYSADEFASALPGVNAEDITAGKTGVAFFDNSITVFVAEENSKRVLAEFPATVFTGEDRGAIYLNEDDWYNEVPLRQYGLAELDGGVVQVTDEDGAVYEIFPSAALGNFIYDAELDAFTFVDNALG